MPGIFKLKYLKNVISIKEKKKNFVEIAILNRTSNNLKNSVLNHKKLTFKYFYISLKTLEDYFSSLYLKL